MGIVNGVDYSEWNPATDMRFAVQYSVEDAARKAANKEALQRRLGLPVAAGSPVAGDDLPSGGAKGVQTASRRRTGILKEDIQFAVLGVGEAVHHRFLETLKAEYPQKVAAVFEFNETLAHQIEAGADIFLMPSRYEPSGLNQLYSLKYGTVPVVRDTGGLHDTVTDYAPATAATATGFVFKEYTAAAFLARSAGHFRSSAANRKFGG